MTERDIIEGKPVLIVIDIQGGETNAMEYLETGARRTSDEIMHAFDAWAASSIQI